MRNILILLLILSSSDLYPENIIKNFRHVYYDTQHDRLRAMSEIADSISGQTTCYKVIFDSNGQVKSYSFERSGEPVKPEDETDLYFHTFDYTDSTEIREYKNYYFRPTCNNLGVYKTALNYNQNGIPVSKENFDQNGQLMADSAGVARYIWELNEENLIVSEKYQNLDGNFITNRWGIFEMKNRWNDDDDFCFFESRYYDKNGKNVISEKDRFAGWDGQFDKSDNLVCATYYDNEGKPAETGSVSGRVRYKYDDNGLMM